MIYLTEPEDGHHNSVSADANAPSYGGQPRQQNHRIDIDLIPIRCLEQRIEIEPVRIRIVLSWGNVNVAFYQTPFTRSYL